jgi:predicted flap endonuclease-1-like 5' DNA nuclease
MDEKKSPNFARGFVIGLLICVIIWYWQKSTAAEDGALDLLDRYADLEKRWRQARQDWSSPQSPAPTAPEAQPKQKEAPEPASDLKQVKGIGPVFDEQLRLAGVTNLAKLTTMSAAQLAEILDIGATRAANILAEAKKLG